MNLLFLRGAVPTDRDPNEIIFSDLKDCDDVWTHLAYDLVTKNDTSEVVYYGGERNHEFGDNLFETWTKSLHTFVPRHKPDVIIARGNFEPYKFVLNKYRDCAFTIMYGAGRRFLPQMWFTNYDLVLQDSKEQVCICKKKFPYLNVSLFIKPAAENIFYPRPEVEKEYDVCFPANGSQIFKGHDFVYNTVPKDIKVLNLGNNPHGYKYPNNVTSYRVLRPEMVDHIAKCKVGIVAVNSKIDSCPRVIPELLACGLPVVVLDTVRFWKEKYITEISGRLANKENFWHVVRNVLENIDSYNPRKHYEEELSMSKASDFIRKEIKRVVGGRNENNI